MEKKLVKDLMVPLADYPKVKQDESLYDVILALEKALEKLPPDRQPYRAVLVVDNNQTVIGKIGYLAFIKGLEPKYDDIGDISRLGRAELNDSFIEVMMSHYQFFQNSFDDICSRAFSIKAKEAMHPLNESIDVNSSLAEAVHKLVFWQTLSILVTSDAKPVGLLRLSDVFDEVKREVRRLSGSDK